jgi:predicted RNase H-like HicB family nuclease
MKAYYAAIIPDAGVYAVLFPDVPGCQTQGDSPEDAFTQAIEALAGHLEALASDGDPIPKPQPYGQAWEKLLEDCREMEIKLPEGALFQLVPAPELDLSPIRVTVSFKRYTLNMIDRKAEAAGMTRSGFLAAAASVCDMSK